MLPPFVTVTKWQPWPTAPAITFATAGNLSVSYSTQEGTFAKIGALVIARAVIVTSAFTHTSASGNLQIQNLPFASFASADVAASQGSLSFQGITMANYTQFTVRPISGSTNAVIDAAGSGQTRDTVKAANMPTGGSVILAFTVIYRVA
jgi:hypothetical protein